MRSRHSSHAVPSRTRSRGRFGAGTVPLILALAAAPACYRYSPASLADLEPDSEVRLTLNDRGSQLVLPGASASRERTVEGRFTSSTRDTVVISVWIGDAYRGTPFESTYQRLAIPGDVVVGVEDRQLSTWRTAVLGAGVVAVIVTLIDRLDVLPIFGGGEGEPLPPPGSAGPIFGR